MNGLFTTQDADIKENVFCNIITKDIFMSLNGLNLSNYRYIMSMYGFSDITYAPKALAVMRRVWSSQSRL